MEEIFSTILTLIPIALIIAVRVGAGFAKKKVDEARTARRTASWQTKPVQKDTAWQKVGGWDAPFRTEEGPAAAAGFSAHRLSLDDDAAASRLKALREKAAAYERQQQAAATGPGALSRPLEELAADASAESTRTAAYRATDIASSSERGDTDRAAAVRYAAHRETQAASAQASDTQPPGSPANGTSSGQAATTSAASVAALPGARLDARLERLSPLARGILMAEVLGPPLAMKN